MGRETGKVVVLKRVVLNCDFEVVKQQEESWWTVVRLFDECQRASS